MSSPRIITRAERMARLKGLGDAVALVAQPIARAIDSVAGTKVAQCGGCKKRQAMLNKLVTFNGSDRPSTTDS